MLRTQPVDSGEPRVDSAHDTADTEHGASDQEGHGGEPQSEADTTAAPPQPSGELQLSAADLALMDDLDISIGRPHYCLSKVSHIRQGVLFSSCLWLGIAESVRLDVCRAETETA